MMVKGINTPREVYAKPQNVPRMFREHSHLCTNCASNFRRTKYFRNTATDEIHMEDQIMVLPPGVWGGGGVLINKV